MQRPGNNLAFPVKSSLINILPLTVILSSWIPWSLPYSYCFSHDAHTLGGEKAEELSHSLREDNLNLLWTATILPPCLLMIFLILISHVLFSGLLQGLFLPPQSWAPLLQHDPSLQTCSPSNHNQLYNFLHLSFITYEAFIKYYSNDMTCVFSLIKPSCISAITMDHFDFLSP